MPKAKSQKVSSTLTVLWWVFGSSIVLFSILAVLVMTGMTTSFDQTILLWLNQHSTAALDAFFLTATNLGGVIFVATASFILFGITLLSKKYYKSLLVVIGMGGVMIINLLLKSIFERPRPDLWEWLISETSYSFPSGHATASMALALCVIILLWWTRWRVAAFIIAALYVLIVGISRMYLGVHFPTDILGGWLLGLAWMSYVSICIYSYQRRHPRERPIEP